MDDHDKKAEIMTNLCECYKKTFTLNAQVLILKALHDVTAGELEKAVHILLRKSKWMPSVAELIETVDEIRKEDALRLNRKVMIQMQKMGTWQWQNMQVQNNVNVALQELKLPHNSVLARDL